MRRARFSCASRPVISSSPLNLLVTGGAGFIGSNLVLELQEQFPAARLTVIDDFRSGDFQESRRLPRRFRRSRHGEL
jgi:nucleoside-diphosphate-sugar epimerase